MMIRVPAAAIALAIVAVMFLYLAAEERGWKKGYSQAIETVRSQ